MESIPPTMDTVRFLHFKRSRDFGKKRYPLALSSRDEGLILETS